MYPGREDVERLDQDHPSREREDPDHLAAEERPDATGDEAQTRGDGG